MKMRPEPTKNPLPLGRGDRQVGYVSIGLTITGDRHGIQLSGAPEAGGSQ